MKFRNCPIWVNDALLYCSALCVFIGIAAHFSNIYGRNGSQPAIKRTGDEADIVRKAFQIKSNQAAVIEFMDFQCPPCRASWPRIKKFIEAHPDVAYRNANYPLSMHRFAFDAAVASLIGDAHGLHDQVFEDLFTGKTDLDPKSLNKYLSLHHLPAILGSSSDGTYRAAVRASRELGDRLHIAGTPTLLVLSKSGVLTEVRSINVLEDYLR